MDDDANQQSTSALSTDQNMDAEQDSQNSQSSQNSDSFSSLCPICYDNMIYPISLACKHVFCFLCVKGAYKENQACPMCRAPIDPAIIIKPTLDPATKIKLTSEEKSFQSRKIEWFYESDRDRNSWWRFDIKTSMEIEEGFQKYLDQPNFRPEVWYTAERQQEMLRQCGSCHLCFACQVALPPSKSQVGAANQKFVNSKFYRYTVDCINSMVLDNALHLGVAIPNGYPSAAGNRRCCRHYRPIENFEASNPKNIEVHISGSVYVIDFVEKIQYAKNGTGRPRLVRRMDELDDAIDQIRGTAGIRE